MLSLDERLNLFQLVVFFVLVSPLTFRRIPPAVPYCSAMTMIPSADGGSSPRHQTNNRRKSGRKLTFPNAVAVSDKDIQTFVRQTGQVAPSRAALGVPSCSQCQHGFAQVFALDPLPTDNRMNSGLLKLTCPILVRAIDDLEDQGMISAFNQQLAADETWQHELLSAHEIHATARQNMLSKADLPLLQARLGSTGSDAFLRAGVAGTSPESKDIKCLHAWLADYLFRCTTTINNRINEKKSNEESVSIGASIVENLGGTDILKGTDDCHSRCDPSSAVVVEPPQARNKQRLKSKRESERRKRRKHEKS